MSKESAIQFMVKVMKEPQLAQEVRRLDAKDLPGLVKVAQREGFEPFNQDEYYFVAQRVGGEWEQWAAKMRGEPVSADISDSDLEHIAGGKGDDSWSDGHSFCLVS